MADDVLQLPLQYLKGVGPRKAADLKKAGLNTVEDLLSGFPGATKTAAVCNRSSPSGPA